VDGIQMKVTIETVVDSRIPSGVLALLVEIAKKFEVDIWVSPPKEEIDGPSEEFLWGV